MDWLYWLYSEHPITYCLVMVVGGLGAVVTITGLALVLLGHG